MNEKRAASVFALTALLHPRTEPQHRSRFSPFTREAANDRARMESASCCSDPVELNVAGAGFEPATSGLYEPNELPNCSTPTTAGIAWYRAFDAALTVQSLPDPGFQTSR